MGIITLTGLIQEMRLVIQAVDNRHIGIRVRQDLVPVPVLEVRYIMQ